MASSKCFQSDELPLDTIIVSSLHQDLALDAVPHALYGSDRWRSYGSDRWRRDQMTIKEREIFAHFCPNRYRLLLRYLLLYYTR